MNYLVTSSDDSFVDWFYNMGTNPDWRADLKNELRKGAKRIKVSEMRLFETYPQGENGIEQAWLIMPEDQKDLLDRALIYWEDSGDYYDIKVEEVHDSYIPAGRSDSSGFDPNSHGHK